MHNAKKVKQTLPMFQRYGPTRYRKYKNIQCHAQRTWPKQSVGKIKYKWRGNLNT